MKNYIKIYINTTRESLQAYSEEELMMYKVALDNILSIKYVNHRERPHRLDGPAIVFYNSKVYSDMYFIDGTVATREEVALAYAEHLAEEAQAKSTLQPPLLL
jgi:hypothetical protein